MDLKDQIDVLFSQMLEDINYIKLLSYFCKEEQEEIEVLL